VAIPGAVELHEPPSVGSLKVMLEPWHTTAGPVMLPGNELTVTTVLLVQPVLSE
jgi:hypothetical protein